MNIYLFVIVLFYQNPVKVFNQAIERTIDIDYLIKCDPFLAIAIFYPSCISAVHFIQNNLRHIRNAIRYLQFK